MTFDGLYYSYQGNCTYVLMEEINSTIHNFGVYIDNYHCDPAQSVSCTRTLTVKHESQEVRLKTVKLIPLKVEVRVEWLTFQYKIVNNSYDEQIFTYPSSAENLL